MLPLFYLISHYSNLPFRAWEQRKFEDCFNFPVSTNSLSRVMLNYDKGEVKNVHYGDVLIKYPCILNIKKEEIPYITGGCLEAYNSNLLENGDLIFADAAEDETVGKAVEVNGITNENLVSGLHTIVARATTQKAKYFLGYYINSDIYHRQLLRLMQGSKVSAISKGNLQKTDVSFPKDIEEQQKIGSYFKKLDSTIALHQRKLDTLKQMKKGLLQQMFPKSEEEVPKIRFADFDEEWYQRKLGEEFEKINERNDGSFGKTHWISVAKMYFVEPNKVLSNNIDTRTYVMRKGDIAFEGNSNTDFKFGRFVANDIGPGIVSELFPVYRHKTNYDNNYWKNAIQLEHIMAPIYSKSITSSGNSSNKLDSKHFLNQKIYIADFEEQEKIGSIFKQLDNTIILYQNKLNKFDILKKAYLQTMFI
ncbi:restriction endonuclease subunit S [Listeria monocytogenes]